MEWLQLVFEFLVIGSFSVGGGLATIPFLFRLTERYDWFTSAQLIDMIAISESTPGPIGINVATFAGYQALGIWGGVLASFSVMLTGLIFMIVISTVLKRFKESSVMKKIFYGLLPTVAALLFFASYKMFFVSLGEFGDWNQLMYNIVLFGISLLLTTKYKWEPFKLIIFAVIVSFIFNGLGIL
jgi:chromate transporter